MRQNYIKILYSFFGIFIISLLFLSCATNPVTGKKELMLISESQEIAMGLEADPGIVANFGMYDNPAMQEFINKKGKEMAAISHRPQLDFQFRILDSPVINAFAVPGGYVYFTRGITAHFNNEAEFAGVLGHEIGHITARHSAAQLSKQQLYTGLLIGGMVLSEDFRKFSDLANTGLGLLFLKFGRDDESQSDELGVQYSTQINYNAHEMANFFGVLSRMREQSGQSIPTFMSTHPDPVDRFQKVHSLADKYQKGTNTDSLQVNRNSYLRMIDGLVFGEDPRQGYVEESTFYHPGLKFYFPVPRDWQLINTPQMVQIAHVENNTANALILFTLAGEKNLEEAKQATIDRDQLQVVESARVNVNGFSAIAMISEQAQQAQNGQAANPDDALRILTYLIQDKEIIYKFHGLTRKGDFNTYYSSFSSTMSKFKRLTDQRKLNVKPERISIKSVSRTSNLEQALQSFRIPADQMEQIAILNNMQLTSTLQKGTLIKTLEKK